MKINRESVVCASVAAASLLTAAACHRFLPGWGAALKPLLWPLLALPSFRVRLGYAVPTALAVPFASALVNGMPSLAAAAELSLVAAVGVAALRLLARHTGRLVRARVAAGGAGA